MGTRYHGSQIQQNAGTVQAEFQRALSGVLGSLPNIKCCSRTDSGVHANMFCISFKNDGGLKPERILMALNTKLARDIRATECTAVGDDFHARYSSTGKRYIYKVWNSRIMDPFFCGRAAQFIPHIDETEIEKTAAVFLGTHDFKAFCSKKTRVEDTRRMVSEISLARDGELVVFSITADGFLYNMARVIVGTLLNVARGKLNGGDIARILESGQRENLIATAPAEGLYLDKVYY